MTIIIGASVIFGFELLSVDLRQIIVERVQDDVVDRFDAVIRGAKELQRRYPCTSNVWDAFVIDHPLYIIYQCSYYNYMQCNTFGQWDTWELPPEGIYVLWDYELVGQDVYILTWNSLMNNLQSEKSESEICKGVTLLHWGQ